MKPRHLRFELAALGAALFFGVTASAEELLFPEGRPPVPQIASAARVGEGGLRARLADAQGRELTPRYDAVGRLVQLKAGPRPNAFDLTAAYYPDGRLGYVAFGNGYSLRFSYDKGGNQTVTDRFGNTLEREALGARQYRTAALTDANGYLAETLRALEAVFIATGAVDGLNAVVVPAELEP